MFAPGQGSNWAPKLGAALRESKTSRRPGPTFRIIAWGFRIALLTTIVNLLIWLSYQEWVYLNLPH